jgi:4-amino-4-deoxy-L-arabinose transferase-like glycosyltransferase
VRRPLVVAAAAWIAALVVVAVVLPSLSYGTRDADSRLYAEIAARMSEEPAARWIAPVWPPGWYGSGYFREHPCGTFLAPAVLGAAGYPAAQAAYLANALWQIGSLLLLACLARRFASSAEAGALLYLLQLIPIAFTYRVRANQEQLLLLLLLVALYATDRVRARWAWAPLVAGACVGLVLVKGMVGLVALPVCALWLLARGDGDARGRAVVRGALALLGAVAAIGVAILAYEALYHAATGEAFLSHHLQRQMRPALALQSQAIVAQKAYNLVWYAGRLVWFPFPWSLTLLVAAVASARALLRGSGERGPATRGLGFAVGVVLLYVGLFSLSDRRADRYIFPAYFAIAAAGAVAALRGGRRAAAVAAWLERLPAWAPAALWLTLALLHVAAGRLLHLPTIKVWDPSR